MESKFKVGDLVRLKSGSPLMTITNIAITGPDQPNFVATSWFVCAFNQFDSTNFPEDAIVISGNDIGAN